MGSPDTLERLGQQVLIGLTDGSVIALIALGYTMVYGIIELINFAHGDVYMLGSFLALTLVGVLGIGAVGGMSPAVGVPILFLAAAVFCALVNVSVECLVYRPLRSAPKIGLLVAAIGVSFALQMAVVYLPPLQTVFKTEPLGLFDWVLVLAISSLPLWGTEIYKAIRRRRTSEQGS